MHFMLKYNDPRYFALFDETFMANTFNSLIEPMLYLVHREKMSHKMITTFYLAYTHFLPAEKRVTFCRKLLLKMLDIESPFPAATEAIFRFLAAIDFGLPVLDVATFSALFIFFKTKFYLMCVFFQNICWR